MEDERFGMSQNRALYEEAHPQAVARFDELVRERNERCFAAMWSMMQIRMGWADLRYPMADIMAMGKLDWGEFGEVQSNDL